MTVKSNVPDSETYPTSVASNAVGDYVVVWSTHFFADNSDEIDGRRYCASGSPMGSQFMISKSSSPSVELLAPNVAINNQGEFVVTWFNIQYFTNQIPKSSIHAQRFNALGQAQGTELAMDYSLYAYSGLFVRSFSNNVGIDSNGDFVVIRETHDNVGDFIYAQVYNWSGSVKGNRITVATGDGSYTSSAFSTAAMDSKGDFVVAWASFIGTNISIKAQRYNLAGTPTSNLITVANGSGTDVKYDISQISPAVAIGSNGAFVVTWVTRDFTGPQEVNSIHVQRYDFRGHASGSAINVYQGDSVSYENAPSIAMNGIGDFVVTWWHSNRTDSNTTVYAHAYKSTGQSYGSRVTVMKSSNYSNNVFPSVAMNGCDNFVIVWQQYIFQATNPYNIVAQRYRK